MKAIATLVAVSVLAAATTASAAPEPSTNSIRIAETGGFDEKANQFELKADYRQNAETWHQRTVIQPTTADAMIATSYLSFGNVPEWKAVEIKYTRRAK